jgi:2-polyprenyl-3-methyl-5-hydroxy-6-metoxy-1,4-benzoquinol methylase
VSFIVGIEPDASSAAAASGVYDRVLAMRLEDVREEFGGRFDAILFGDVLEHLPDPSSALVRVRAWLTAAGVVAASVPNVGHWSILADLLEGRFEYVPYSILSGTHIRFFTRSTLIDLFEASGYRVDSIETVDFPPPPSLRAQFERLAAFPGASPDLASAEFLVVARPDESAMIAA